MKKETNISPFRLWTVWDSAKYVGFMLSAPFMIPYLWIEKFLNDLFPAADAFYYSETYDELTIDGVTTNAKGETWKY